MPITKRTTIDNTIFKELNEKYPPASAENGVAYKQKLDYLTFETDFMTGSNFRTLRDKYSNDIIAVIFYIRTKMCENGWKVSIDSDSYKYLIEDCSYSCKIDSNKVNDMLSDLINQQIFFLVQDESIEKGKWLTCPQQIYNYEMACNNRQSSRARNAKRRTQQHCPYTDLPPNNIDLFENTSNEASTDANDPFGLFPD